MTLPPRLQALLKNEKALWTLFAVLALGIAWISSPRTVEEQPAPDLETAETFIPHGHLLIPLELKNADRLEGLLGSHGIVDLYQAATETQPSARLVGRRLRLIRAPLNPQSFAVLVRDAEADRLASFPGPFVASVRSRDSESHEVVSSKRQPLIEYHKESSP